MFEIVLELLVLLNVLLFDMVPFILNLLDTFDKILEKNLVFHKRNFTDAQILYFDLTIESPVMKHSKIYKRLLDINSSFGFKSSLKCKVVSFISVFLVFYINENYNIFGFFVFLKLDLNCFPHRFTDNQFFFILTQIQNISIW